MTNGKCPTWFVAQWLEKHPTHTASAPATAPSFDARTPDFAFVSTDRMGAPVIVGVARYRNDWTIVDERGVPVEFKRKRKPTRAGTLLVTNHGGLRIVLGESIAPGEYDLFTRERRS